MIQMSLCIHKVSPESSIIARFSVICDKLTLVSLDWLWCIFKDLFNKLCLILLIRVCPSTLVSSSISDHIRLKINYATEIAIVSSYNRSKSQTNIIEHIESRLQQLILPMHFSAKYCRFQAWFSSTYIRSRSNKTWHMFGNYLALCMNLSAPTDHSKMIILMLLLFCRVIWWQAGEPFLVSYGLITMFFMGFFLSTIVITTWGEEWAGHCAGLLLVCPCFVILHFTTLPLGAIFDCGTPWRPLHCFLFMSYLVWPQSN